MDRDRRGALPVVGFALAAIACCGLPLLAAGALTAAGGLVLGSIALVGAGAVLFAWGAWRRRGAPGLGRTTEEALREPELSPPDDRR